MKHILLIAVLLISFGATAQSVDSTKCGYAVKIQPFKANYLDTTKAYYISARIVADDMYSSCTFYYELKDTFCNRLVDGNAIIDGEDYQNWEGSSEEAYKYIADKINVTLYKN